MNDTWLRSFVEVGKRESLTVAARYLYVTPQALWQQMQRLEQETGLRLMKRNHAGVSLTAAGNRFLKSAIAMIGEYDTALRECRRIQDEGADVRTQAIVPVADGIPLSAFWQRMRQGLASEQSSGPRIILKFMGADVSMPSYINGLMNGAYDLVELHSIDGVHPNTIHYEPMGDDSSSILVDSSDELAQIESLTPEHLRGRTLASFNPNVCAPIVQWLEAHGAMIKVNHIPCNQLDIIAACSAGEVCMVESGITCEAENIVKIPLCFNFNLKRGLACRLADAESLSSAFRLARLLEDCRQSEDRS